MGAINNPFPVSTASFSSASYYYTELLSDGDDVVSRLGTVAQGMVWKRGTILKLTPAGTAGTPGALSVPAVETDCNCILAQDIDTSATGTNAAGTAMVYVAGKFKVDAITWPPTGVHGLIDQNLRMMGLFLESVVTNTGLPVLPYATTPLSPEAARAEATAKRAAADKAEDAAKQAEAEAKRAEEAAKAAESEAKKAEAEARPATHHEHPAGQPAVREPDKREKR